MLTGEDRVAALLSTISDSGVDLKNVAQLKAYRKLLKLRNKCQPRKGVGVNNNGEVIDGSAGVVEVKVSPLLKSGSNGKKKVELLTRCADTGRQDSETNSSDEDEVNNTSIYTDKKETVRARKSRNKQNKVIDSHRKIDHVGFDFEKSQTRHDLSGTQFEGLHPLAKVHKRHPVLTWILGILAAFVVYWVHQQELLTHRGFSRFWLNWENVGLQAEMCTIDLPDRFQDIFRPMVDCSMCRHVNAVDHVSNLSPEIFEERYAYSGRPVLILDGQQNWSASDVFSFEYFKSIYSSDSPVLTHSYRDCQFFPYQTNFNNLRDVFNMSRERVKMKGEPWYIGWSNCDSSAANAIRQHYSRPYFLPAASEPSKMDWIFMGTPGYGAHLHIDHVGKPSWQAQIRGSKTWTLEPPPECFLECQTLTVTVHPGNIIVLDTNMWYHKTKIVSDELSITIGSEYD